MSPCLPCGRFLLARTPYRTKDFVPSNHQPLDAAVWCSWDARMPAKAMQPPDPRQRNSDPGIANMATYLIQPFVTQNPLQTTRLIMSTMSLILPRVWSSGFPHSAIGRYAQRAGRIEIAPRSCGEDALARAVADGIDLGWPVCLFCSQADSMFRVAQNALKIVTWALMNVSTDLAYQPYQPSRCRMARHC
jgi:hypothetical protein